MVIQIEAASADKTNFRLAHANQRRGCAMDMRNHRPGNIACISSEKPLGTCFLRGADPRTSPGVCACALIHLGKCVPSTI